MKNKRKLFFAIGITVATVAGFSIGQMFFDQQSVDSKPIRAMVPESARKLAFPALQKTNGGSFDSASLQNKWTLLFFGYTNCPDVCPATLNSVALAKQQYEKQGIGQSGKQFPQVVFISVDPQRDSIQALEEYVHYFDKDFIGATGEEKLLTAIAVQVSSNFIVEASENEIEYQVGHSLNLVLVNPATELVAILRAPHTSESIVDAIEHFQQ
ncbi:MAG: hypothetical protein DRQ44_13980 [Gammaproteobacteria bacterium]|nr:MAG: hypothetical protein DRQ44_13980 [Gammaproteobacteria bacterium]